MFVDWSLGIQHCVHDVIMQRGKLIVPPAIEVASVINIHGGREEGVSLPSLHLHWYSSNWNGQGHWFCRDAAWDASTNFTTFSFDGNLLNPDLIQFVSLIFLQVFLHLLIATLTFPFSLSTFNFPHISGRLILVAPNDISSWWWCYTNPEIYTMVKIDINNAMYWNSLSRNGVGMLLKVRARDIVSCRRGVCE